MHIVDVEVCRNCYRHNWHTKHDPQRYEDALNQLTNALKKECCDLKIEKNSLPLTYVPAKDKFFSEDVYYDPTADEFKTFPQVGAFEVRVFGRLVYSKLKTGQWPYIPYVVSIIKELVSAHSNDEDLDYVLQRVTKSFEKNRSSVNMSKTLLLSGSLNKILIAEPSYRNTLAINRSRQLEPLKGDLVKPEQRSKTLAAQSQLTPSTFERSIASKNRSISPFAPPKKLQSFRDRTPQELNRLSTKAPDDRKKQENNHKFRINRFNSKPKPQMISNTSLNNTSLRSEEISINNKTLLTNFSDEASIIKDIAFQEIQNLTNLSLKKAVDEILMKELYIKSLIKDFENKQPKAAEPKQENKIQVFEPSTEEVNIAKSKTLEGLKVRANVPEVNKAKDKGNLEIVMTRVTSAKKESKGNQKNQKEAQKPPGDLLGLSGAVKNENNKLSPKIQQQQVLTSNLAFIKADDESPELNYAKITIDYSKTFIPNTSPIKKEPDLIRPSSKKSTRYENDNEIEEEIPPSGKETSVSNKTGDFHRGEKQLNSNQLSRLYEIFALKLINQGSNVYQSAYLSKMLNVLAGNDPKGSRPQFRKEKYTPSKKAEPSLSENPQDQTKSV